MTASWDLRSVPCVSQRESGLFLSSLMCVWFSETKHQYLSFPNPLPTSTIQTFLLKPVSRSDVNAIHCRWMLNTHTHTGLFLSLGDFKSQFAFTQGPMQDSTCYLSGCGSLADRGGGFETDTASRSNGPRASSKRLLLSGTLSQPYVCVLCLLKGLKRKAVCWRGKGCKCCLINS